MVRAARMPHLAEALYQVVAMSEHAKLSDLSATDRQRYLIAAERAFRHVEPDLLRSGY